VRMGTNIAMFCINGGQAAPSRFPAQPGDTALSAQALAQAAWDRSPQQSLGLFDDPAAWRKPDRFQGENYLAVAPGANDALTPERAHELEPLIAEAAILLLQMEIPSATTLALLELARAHGARILFNYAPVRDLDVPIGPAMTGLIVNETEAAALAGCSVSSASEASTAAALLRTRGPEFVVITLGAAGAYVDSGDVQALIPAFPVQPVDTTAAGDTFCGALAVALVEGQPLAQAARFANAASALTVTQAGAQPSIPHRPAINTLLTDPM